MSTERPSRRAVIKAGAWSTPAVVLASSVPAFAASTGANGTLPANTDASDKWPNGQASAREDANRYFLRFGLLNNTGETQDFLLTVVVSPLQPATSYLGFPSRPPVQDPVADTSTYVTPFATSSQTFIQSAIMNLVGISGTPDSAFLTAALNGGSKTIGLTLT